MIVKWRTRSYPPTEIKRVECTRETEKCVYVASLSGREHRSMKISDYEQYHDTWSDAKAYLLSKARREVEAYEANLHAARAKFDQIASLKEPM